MSSTALTLVLLAAGTYALKAAAPLALGGRSLPGGLRVAADLLPAALLAALVAVSTVGSGDSFSLDARLVGVAVAGIALWRRAPFVLVVALAAAATAAARLIA